MMRVGELLGYPVFADPSCPPGQVFVLDARTVGVVLDHKFARLFAGADFGICVVIHPDNDLNLIKQNDKITDALAFLTADSPGGLQ